MKSITERLQTNAVDVSRPMRASWKGYLRLGDLMMPVRLYSATRSISPRFVQLHAEDHEPIRRVTLCSRDGEQLTEGDIVRAVEYAGVYVEIDDDELERNSPLERDIVIRQITEPGDIDSIYYDNPYYVIPDAGGELAYAIVRRAFEKTRKNAVATFLFYGRERLALISCQDGMIHLHTLRFHEEIVPKNEVPIPALPQPSPSQIAVASQLLERYAMPFHASDYRDQQADVLNEFIERKAKGLPPKKLARISSSATPENEVMAKMRQMLGEDPRALRS